MNWRSYLKIYLSKNGYISGSKNNPVGLFNVLQKQASLLWKREKHNQIGGEVSYELQSNGFYKIGNKIYVNKDEYDFLNNFIYKVLPSVKVNNNYLGYEAIISLQLLNKGSFGISYKFIDDENNNYVLKLFFPHIYVYEIESIKNELKMASIISYNTTSDEIAKTYALFNIYNNQTLPEDLIPSGLRKLLKPVFVGGLIMEQGLGDLSRSYYDYMIDVDNISKVPNTTPIDMLVYFLIKLSKGLIYLGKKEFVHGDIKPDNVIVTKCDTFGIKPKFIDFGSLTKMVRGKAKYLAGTLLYTSPEFRMTKSHIDQKYDVWATTLTVLLFFNVITEKQLINIYIETEPVKLRGYHEQIINIVKTKLPILIGYKPKKYNINVLLKCMSVSKDQRFTPTQMYTALTQEAIRMNTP
jgi:serine/threonine protein kinase